MNGGNPASRSAVDEDLEILDAQLKRCVFSAREQAAGVLLPLLRHELQVRLPHIDPDLIHDAVVEAIMAYLDRPTRFDRTKSPTLHAFLYRAAHQKLCNHIHSAQCRAARECKWATERGSLEEQPGESGVEVCSPPQQYTMETIQALALRVPRTEEERRCFNLLLAGETDLSAYTKLIGLSGAGLAWQRRAVKRIKDRLKARLRRMPLPEIMAAPASGLFRKEFCRNRALGSAIRSENT